MGAHGSAEYALTWKEWDIPSGPPICALRASGRRTSGSDFGGWPTPTKDEAGGTPEQALARKQKLRDKGVSIGVSVTHLSHVAQAAGWPTPQSLSFDKSHQPGMNAGMAKTIEIIVGWNTPRATDGSNGGPNQAGGALPHDAMLMSGWATPTSRDHKDGGSTLANTPVNGLLGRQVLGSPEPTEKRGALAPDFVAWLMGFPPSWLEAAPVHTARKPSKNAGRKKAQKVIPVMLACERCGATEGLSRHHRDRDTENNRESNLEVLCRPCHVAEHLTDGTWGTGATPQVECAICGEFFQPNDHPGRAMICSEVCLSELGRRAAMKRWHGESLSLYSRTEFLAGSGNSKRLETRSSRKSRPSLSQLLI